MMRSRPAVCAALCAFTMLGCSGGGPSGGSSPPPAQPPTQPPATGSPTLQVAPSTAFDFGVVTVGNLPAPLEVTIANTGSAPLAVSGIALTAASSSNFSVQLNAGARPCGSTTPTIAAGDFCNLRVVFQPTGSQTYTGSVNITSNGGSFSLPITGTSAAISAWSVRINQLDTACPTNAATAYVSVLDQGGFPVLGLTRSNFTVTQGSPPSTDLLAAVAYVDAINKPVAIAGVLDHSASLTSRPVDFANMKSGFAALFSGMGASDVAAVINFDAEVEVVQGFTSDKTRLLAALAAPWDKGTYTRLYDAVYLAVDQAATMTSYRRAVIVTTDGQDEGPTTPYSTRSLIDVINNATSKNVPIFTVGIGENINETVLRQMAADTGGAFYLSNTSQNLATIYQQLSTVLFQRQYVLTFDQLVRGSSGVVSPLTVSALGGPSGTPVSAVTNIRSCN